MKANLVLGVLALSLCACSASVDGGDVPTNFPAAKPADFSNLVAGPDLSGTYDSTCLADNRTSNFIKFHQVVAGQSITRVETLFSDAACNQQVKVTTRTGVYRYNHVISGTDYEVDYRFSLNGGYYELDENLRLTQSSLYITNCIGGDAYPDMELRKVSTLADQ